MEIPPVCQGIYILLESIGNIHEQQDWIFIFTIQAAFGKPSGKIQESGVRGFNPHALRAWSHRGEGSLFSHAGLNSLQIEDRFS